jgi:hypothetical protein
MAIEGLFSMTGGNNELRQLFGTLKRDHTAQKTRMQR